MLVGLCGGLGGREELVDERGFELEELEGEGVGREGGGARCWGTLTEEEGACRVNIERGDGGMPEEASIGGKGGRGGSRVRVGGGRGGKIFGISIVRF